MKTIILALCSLIISSAAMAGQTHQCKGDAIKRADKLLRLHFSETSSEADVDDLSIDNDVVVKSPSKVAVGKGHLDVLEVTGYIYRTTYIMKFKYAQIEGTCAMMGEEIYELSNPY